MNQQPDTHKFCTHIKKLSKKSLQSLTNRQYNSRCGTCMNKFKKDSNGDYWICLHCGEVMCGDKQECVQHHCNEQQHQFSLKLKIEPYPEICENNKEKEKGIICCRKCGSVSSQVTLTANNEQQRQQHAKISRFTQYIYCLENKICQIMEQSWKEQAQNQTISLIKPVGLVNLGNTCFLNVILQSLLHTDPFINIYINWNDLLQMSRKKKNRKFIQMFYDEVIEEQQHNKWHIVQQKSKNRGKNRYGQQFVPSHMVKDTKFNVAVSEFVKVFVVEQEANEAISLEPVQLLHKLGEFDAKYRLKGEQDAEELLILMLDLLSQGEFISMCSMDRDKKERYDKIETLLGRQKLTPSQNAFGTYLASRVSCLGCFKESWTLDFTYHMSVSLTNLSQQQQVPQKIKKITESSEPISGISYFTSLFYPKKQQQTHKFSSLDHFFSPERLTLHKNYFKCEGCSGLAALKQFYIVEPPPILLISLKRFDPHRKLSKINKYIEFPQTLNLTNYTLQPQDNEEVTKYSLYGVIVHLGETIDSGHYICYIKRKDCNGWFRYSDTCIRKVQVKQVLNQDAYILLYERVDGQQSK